LLRDCFDLPNLANETEFDWSLARAARLAAQVGDHELIARASEWPHADRPLSLANRSTTEAIAHESAGRYEPARDSHEDSADRWRALGVPYELGMARLGAGRCDLVLGRPAAAAGALNEARSIFRRLGAEPALAETNALLAGCGEVSFRSHPAAGLRGDRR
jgi:tetratricopeptide (TPR) repeat protein